ncbi:hypothetical protein EWM64_g4631 [Hericium alpestre]|uniref:Uncharacterized protein n=1 Tax=Hericium alpestre TaxID=135208 RepID=A0A4Y9ZZI2_9AGAM|nr:hypothetical protein EWM64_g4631 [Hericium alpestre]
MLNYSQATPRTQIPPQISVPLPADYKTIHRFYWYGYNVGHDWLMEYARKHLGPERSAKVRPIQQLSYARNRLRRKTGIRTLALSIARRDETTPPNPALTVMGNICILSIFTAGGSSYRNRPTQAQVDQLTKILGCQPRWWVDGETMESYYQ